MSSPNVNLGRLRLGALISESIAAAVRISTAAPLVALAFVLWAGVLAVASYSLPPNLTWLYLAMLLVSAFIYCLYSLHLFAQLLEVPKISSRAAWKLVNATLLFTFLTAMFLAILILFFTMVGASIGIVSGVGDPAATDDIVAQMRSGGTFWPVFALFLAAIASVFWFVSRLFLFSVATAATGAIHIFRTWPWTKPAERVVVLSVSGLVLLPNLFYFLGCEWLVRTWGLGEAGAGQFVIFEMSTALLALPLIWLNHALAAQLYSALAPAEVAA